MLFLTCDLLPATPAAPRAATPVGVDTAAAAVAADDSFFVLLPTWHFAFTALVGDGGSDSMGASAGLVDVNCFMTFLGSGTVLAALRRQGGRDGMPFVLAVRCVRGSPCRYLALLPGAEHLRLQARVGDGQGLLELLSDGSLAQLGRAGGGAERS